MSNVKVRPLSFLASIFYLFLKPYFWYNLFISSSRYPIAYVGR